ncbi:MAG: efflux RND transporter periplasmic adaptor subunit [Gemmatimonadaceae bacterium]|nr:efflux RND transporter periplasmic adaptor subunit [Gemmatimonadaceae bacterium]
MRLIRLAFIPFAGTVLAVVACGGGSAQNATPSSGGGGPGGRGGRGAPSDRPIPVEIQLVSRGEVARTSTIAGILQPIRIVAVNAQLSGIVLAVKAEEGARVERGQALAELDARELEAQVRGAESSLALAEANFRRSEQLRTLQIITQAEYDRDQAALAASRASLDQLRTRLGYARIVAPTTGVVTEKRVEAGDAVSTQTRLFTIADVSTLVTRVQVSELEVRSLRAGDRVQLTVDALAGEGVNATIRRIFPSADSATRLVPVEIALTGSILDRLRPGYTVRAVFLLDRRTDALLVPSRAISGPVGARAAFVVAAGLVERRTVRVGPDLDGRTEVLEGLAEGDSVIVSGSAMLREGAKARVVPPLGDVRAPAVEAKVLDSSSRATSPRSGRKAP